MAPPDVRASQTLKVDKLREPTLYERLTYFLDILVPEEEVEDMRVPRDHYLQQVHYGKVHRYRIMLNKGAGLPDYLMDEKKLTEPYIVFKEKEGFLPLFDPTSVFNQRWDALGLILLLFTASVTPFETAFVTGPLHIDVLFLINIIVDAIFAFDMFVQMRTPARDPETGKIIRKGSAIALRYVKTWFFIDLVSVIPFELLNLNENMASTNLNELRLLRFLRLTRLLKLLRVLRASRKLKQWQVYVNLRYSTLQLLKLVIMLVFLIHWLACGYRLATEKNSPTDPAGWLEHYADYRNTTAQNMDVWEVYIAAVYWSSATISLVGPTWDMFAATTPREQGFQFFATFIAYVIAMYMIATLGNVLEISGKTEREHDLKVDKFLQMFNRLKLDMRLRIKVHEFLSDHFAVASAQEHTNLLKELPPQLHGFITMEIFVDFIMEVPYLEAFVDREPMLIQELCRGVEIQSFPPNAQVFMEGYEGIYYLEHGIMAIDGRVYPSGTVFGRTILRQQIYQTEGRALTNVTIHVLPKHVLLAVLSKYPKIAYYVKRWTNWQVLRRYIYKYTKLYYTAAKRGLRYDPPLLSGRPNLGEGEYDEIDFAVMEHMAEMGF